MIPSATTTHGYVAHYYINNLDNFNVQEQYRLLYDLPDGRFVAPQVRQRMFYRGESASQALEHVRQFIPSPFSPNSLSPSLYDAPSLIDEERWHEAGAKLRREGASYKSRGKKVQNLTKIQGLFCLVTTCSAMKAGWWSRLIATRRSGQLVSSHGVGTRLSR